MQPPVYWLEFGRFVLYEVYGQSEAVFFTETRVDGSGGSINTARRNAGFEPGYYFAARPDSDGDQHVGTGNNETLAFRHMDQSNAAYVDGHVEMLDAGIEAEDLLEGFDYKPFPADF
jgi:prepilin-type processing-associated H-X9-DG protein